MKDSFLLIVDRFMFPEPVTLMGGWEWPSEKHREVAEAYEEYIKGIDQSNTLANHGLMLWSQYCEKANPAIRNPQIYTAALIYFVLSHSPDPVSISQKQLAEFFGITPGSISTKYRDMKKVLQ